LSQAKINWFSSSRARLIASNKPSRLAIFAVNVLAADGSNARGKGHIGLGQRPLKRGVCAPAICDPVDGLAVIILVAKRITEPFTLTSKTSPVVFTFSTTTWPSANVNASQHEVALRVRHFYNAGIKLPNPGENFRQLRYTYTL
jgi:hypothetical protein